MTDEHRKSLAAAFQAAEVNFNAPQGERMTKPNERHVPVLFKEAIGFSQRAARRHVRRLHAGTCRACRRHRQAIGICGAFDRIRPRSRGARFGTSQARKGLRGAGQPGAASEFGRRGIQQHRRAREPASIDGLLADFGVSSLQFDEARRGFSFQADGPLDMRMDTRSGPTAEQVVNEMSERELANLIYEYGEERRSRTVARAIVRGRPVTSTAQLARIVASAVPPMKHIHPATRTFQALRIYCQSGVGRNPGIVRGRTKVA